MSIYQPDDAIPGKQFIGNILDASCWVWPNLPVLATYLSELYPAAIGRLLVQPLQGELQAGPAHIVTPTNSHHRIAVLGSQIAYRRRAATVERQPFSGESAQPENHKGTEPEADIYLEAWVQGLEPELWVRPGTRLLQGLTPPARDPYDPLDDTRQRAAQRWHVRLAALQVLATLGHDVPVEPLVRALDDDARRVRDEAASMLGQLGGRAPLEPFLRGIQDKSTENQILRRAAPDVLGAYADDPRVPGALEELLYDPNDGLVSAAAAHVLGRLAARAPVASLFASLHDTAFTGFGSRLMFIWGIRELTGPLPAGALDALAQGLRDANSQVRTEAARVLAAHRDQVPQEIWNRAEQVLQDDRQLHADMKARERETLAQFERTIEPDSPEGWLQALDSSEWETRVAAIRRLATMGAQAPLDRLLALVADDDDDGNGQVAAAEALGSLGGQMPLDARVVEILFHRVSSSRDDPQFAAEHALAALAPWLPQETLVAHLGDTHWKSRDAALEALVALGAAAPVDILLAAVGDLSEDVRGKALEALQRAHPHALPPLVEEALAVLGGQPAGWPLNSLVRSLQAEDIGQRRLKSSEAIAELTEFLHWPYWHVRLSAIKALAYIGPPLPGATLDALEELRRDSQSAAVREAAAEALNTGE